MTSAATLSVAGLLSSQITTPTTRDVALGVSMDVNYDADYINPISSRYDIYQYDSFTRQKITLSSYTTDLDDYYPMVTAAFPDHDLVFAINENDSNGDSAITLKRFDTDSDSISTIATISSHHFTNQPLMAQNIHGLAVSPDGKSVYASVETGSYPVIYGIMKIDISNQSPSITNTFIREEPMGDSDIDVGQVAVSDAGDVYFVITMPLVGIPEQPPHSTFEVDTYSQIIRVDSQTGVDSIIYTSPDYSRILDLVFPSSGNLLISTSATTQESSGQYFGDIDSNRQLIVSVVNQGEATVISSHDYQLYIFITSTGALAISSDGGAVAILGNVKIALSPQEVVTTSQLRYGEENDYGNFTLAPKIFNDISYQYEVVSINPVSGSTTSLETITFQPNNYGRVDKVEIDSNGFIYFMRHEYDTSGYAPSARFDAIYRSNPENSTTSELYRTTGPYDSVADYAVDTNGDLIVALDLEYDKVVRIPSGQTAPILLFQNSDPYDNITDLAVALDGDIIYSNFDGSFDSYTGYQSPNTYLQLHRLNAQSGFSDSIILNHYGQSPYESLYDLAAAPNGDAVVALQIRNASFTASTAKILEVSGSKTSTLFELQSDSPYTSVDNIEFTNDGDVIFELKQTIEVGSGSAPSGSYIYIHDIASSTNKVVLQTTPGDVYEDFLGFGVSGDGDLIYAVGAPPYLAGQSQPTVASTPLSGGSVTTLANINKLKDLVVRSKVSGIAPVARNDSATTAEDTPVVISILGNDTDADNAINPASVILSSQPTRGQVSINSDTGKVTYTPNSNYFGSDVFSYKVRDVSGLLSNPATVSITISSVNDAPEVTRPPEPAGFVVNLPQKLFMNYRVTDVDASPTAQLAMNIAVTRGSLISGSTSGKSLSFTGSLASLNSSLANIQYKSNVDDIINETITFTVNDKGNSGAGGAKSKTATFVVAPANNIAVKIADPSLPGKTSLVLQGSANADSISVTTSAASKTTFIVTAFGATATFTGITGRILAYGLGGNDIGSFKSVAIPTRLDGGDGNDIITGGTAADTIFGGNGADLLIGNLGADSILGQAGNDILIDGNVTLANANDSLSLVLNSWASSASPNNTLYNSITSRLRVTLDKSAADSLTGGTGVDWFWTAPTSTFNDILTDIVAATERRRIT